MPGGRLRGYNPIHRKPGTGEERIETPRYQGANRTARRASASRALVASLLTALLLSGCTGDLNTPGEALRILGAGLAPAYLGQAYNQPVQAVGGLRPYDFALADGALPPGVELQGGTLRGTPSKTGRYTFTLQVTDANLSKTVQQYTLSVSELPPPGLTLNAPTTEVDHRITLRGQLHDGRGFQGLRTQIRWDPQRFQLVQGSIRASRQGLAVFHQAASGQLQVALAPLGTTVDGEAGLFQFDLQPTDGASYLKLDVQTEFMSVGGHDFAQTSEGREPPSNPTGTTDAAPGKAIPALPGNGRTP